MSQSSALPFQSSAANKQYMPSISDQPQPVKNNPSINARFADSKMPREQATHTSLIVGVGLLGSGTGRMDG